MILVNDFFYIRELHQKEREIHADLSINKDHRILSGHFPGFPVMPGVCMMQIVREVFQEATGIPVRIIQGDNIKFLAVLNPLEHVDVRIFINHEGVDDDHVISASLTSMKPDPVTGEPVIFFKFKGRYRAENSFVQ